MIEKSSVTYIPGPNVFFAVCHNCLFITQCCIAPVKLNILCARVIIDAGSEVNNGV